MREPNAARLVSGVEGRSAGVDDRDGRRVETGRRRVENFDGGLGGLSDGNDGGRQELSCQDLADGAVLLVVGGSAFGGFFVRVMGAGAVVMTVVRMGRVRRFCALFGTGRAGEVPDRGGDCDQQVSAQDEEHDGSRRERADRVLDAGAAHDLYHYRSATPGQSGCERRKPGS